MDKNLRAKINAAAASNPILEIYWRQATLGVTTELEALAQTVLDMAFNAQQVKEVLQRQDERLRVLEPKDDSAAEHIRVLAGGPVRP
jgi:hypothetical protein